VPEQPWSQFYGYQHEEAALAWNPSSIQIPANHNSETPRAYLVDRLYTKAMNPTAVGKTFRNSDYIINATAILIELSRSKPITGPAVWQYFLQRRAVAGVTAEREH